MNDERCPDCGTGAMFPWCGFYDCESPIVKPGGPKGRPGYRCVCLQLADRDQRLKTIAENFETVSSWALVAIQEHDDDADTYKEDKRSVAAIWTALGVPDPNDSPEANKS